MFDSTVVYTIVLFFDYEIIAEYEVWYVIRSKIQKWQY